MSDLKNDNLTLAGIQNLLSMSEKQHLLNKQNDGSFEWHTFDHSHKSMISELINSLSDPNVKMDKIKEFTSQGIRLDIEVLCFNSDNGINSEIYNLLSSSKLYSPDELKKITPEASHDFNESRKYSDSMLYYVLNDEKDGDMFYVDGGPHSTKEFSKYFPGLEKLKSNKLTHEEFNQLIESWLEKLDFIPSSSPIILEKYDTTKEMDREEALTGVMNLIGFAGLSDKQINKIITYVSDMEFKNKSVAMAGLARGLSPKAKEQFLEQYHFPPEIENLCKSVVSMSSPNVPKKTSLKETVAKAIRDLGLTPDAVKEGQNKENPNIESQHNEFPNIDDSEGR